MAYDEAVRSVRESILLSDIDHPIRTVLITSALPREGKSTFATNLAVVNAQQNTKTLLIDADMRRPSAYIRLALENNAGLTEIIRDDRDWKDLLQTVPGVPSLQFLAAGQASQRAYDLLGATLERILESARRDFSLVIIDAPPLLGFAEPLKAASLADGVVVVTSSETQRNALQSVLTALRRVKARVLGVVMNNVDQKHSNRYYYGGYYGYYGKYYSHYYGSEPKA
jgi:capsular exopolysaccharide synthesis family protein